MTLRWVCAATTIAAALSISSLPSLEAAKPAPKRPNIVILLADDWGFTDVGAFGGEIATPNIDALAASGVRFSNFHVAGSCSPTRAMLQTGVINHRAGLGNMHETMPPEHLGKPGYQAELNDRVVTIADRLRANGYRTYLTGKWHLGKSTAKLPTARGYDHAFSLSQSGADNFEEKPNLLLYDKADWTEDGRPARLPKNFYSSRFIVDKMLGYIESDRASGKPFLASVNFIANHIPVQAPEVDLARYSGRYADGWTKLREQRRTGAIAKGVMPTGVKMVAMTSTGNWDTLTPEQRAQRSGAMSAYAAMGTAMDREVGRLVTDLKNGGEYENTIFVFLSDNGAEAIDPMNSGAFIRWNANHHYDQRTEKQGRPGSLTAIGAGFASAASSPLRGYKFSASEGGLRVPLIISWPGNPAIRRGSVAKGFAHVTDIAPTLLSLAGVASQDDNFEGRKVEPMIGRDLAPMLAGTVDSVHPETASLGYELAGNAVLFKGTYKLVKNLPPYGDGLWHLYDIDSDPGETTDLSKADPVRFSAMKADYAMFAKENRVLPMPDGFSAPIQIRDNAMGNLFIPRLLHLWPWALALLGVSLAAVILWRRRRNGAV